MKSSFILPSMLLIFALPATAQPSQAHSDETIVFFRHGEKPKNGLGQLSCQGLNRALALPSSSAFKARPDFLFAPDPGGRKRDGGVEYDYVRPFATIEPLAVFFGMPVNAEFHFRQFVFDEKTGELHRPKSDPPFIKEILSDKYANALIYACWEHFQIIDMVDYLLAKAGTPPAQPTKWDDEDYDGLIRVTLRRKPDGSLDSVSVVRDSEGISPASDCRF